MFIRIVRPVTLMVCDHDPNTGIDWCRDRDFKVGEILAVGEKSDFLDEPTTVIELLGLGFVELPNDCFVWYERIVYRFRPTDDPPRN